MSKTAKHEKYLKDARVRAFLAMISKAEGTTKYGYHTLVGNTRIADLSKHPNKKIFLGKDKRGRDLWSTAAGRAQFLFRTWKPIALKLELPDFGPRSQDIATVELLIEGGAIPLILKDKIADAVFKVRKIWASFPGAGYGQGERTMSFMLKAYKDALSKESPVVMTVDEEQRLEQEQIVTANTVSLPAPAQPTPTVTVEQTVPAKEETPIVSRVRGWWAALPAGAFSMLSGAWAWFKDGNSRLAVALFITGAVVAVVYIICHFISKERREQRAHNQNTLREAQAHELNKLKLTAAADPARFNVELVPQHLQAPEQEGLQNAA